MNSGEEPRLQEAIQVLHSALDQHFFDGFFRYGLAPLLTLSGDLVKALRHLNQAEKFGVDGSLLRMWLDGLGSQGQAAWDIPSQATEETTS